MSTSSSTVQVEDYENGAAAMEASCSNQQAKNTEFSQILGDGKLIPWVFGKYCSRSRSSTFTKGKAKRTKAQAYGLTYAYKLSISSGREYLRPSALCRLVRTT
ncbi:hypothetical protein NPIL_466621 [Nephila pilipes]|uniref:Uncharacterized protein n=1 Tax=Nephila pilipes TaxID=299642 RepID=A0A8X6T837_NEPPI|nr:hypothetical protein NPIL_466621 [Nephila pilipes]